MFFFFLFLFCEVVSLLKQKKKPPCAVNFESQKSCPVHIKPQFQGAKCKPFFPFNNTSYVATCTIHTCQLRSRCVHRDHRALTGVDITNSRRPHMIRYTSPVLRQRSSTGNSQNNGSVRSQGTHL